MAGLEQGVDYLDRSSVPDTEMKLDCFVAKLVNYLYQASYFAIGNGAKKQRKLPDFVEDDPTDPQFLEV